MISWPFLVLQGRVSLAKERNEKDSQLWIKLGSQETLSDPEKLALVKQLENILEEYSYFLSLLESNIFKIRAFRKAKISLHKSWEDLDKLLTDQNLRALDNVGPSVEKLLLEAIKTHGKPDSLKRLKQQLPEWLLELSSRLELRNIIVSAFRKIPCLYKKEMFFHLQTARFSSLSNLSRQHEIQLANAIRLEYSPTREKQTKLLPAKLRGIFELNVSQALEIEQEVQFLDSLDWILTPQENWSLNVRPMVFSHPFWTERANTHSEFLSLCKKSASPLIPIYLHPSFFALDWEGRYLEEIVARTSVCWILPADPWLLPETSSFFECLRSLSKLELKQSSGFLFASNQPFHGQSFSNDLAQYMDDFSLSKKSVLNFCNSDQLLRFLGSPR